MRLPRTTRHIMVMIAVIGLTLGLMINFPWLLPVLAFALVITLPQTLVVLICACLAARDNPDRDGIKWLGKVNYHRTRRH